MTTYDLAGLLVFAVLSLAAWAVVEVVCAMPTKATGCRTRGCHCRGQLSVLDHADGLTAAPRKTP